jgi:signal transduction histidine kinase
MMSVSEAPPEFRDVLDRADWAMSRVFSILESEVPAEERYLVFIPLLEGFGAVAPGYDLEAVKATLEGRLSEAARQALQGHLDELGSILRNHLRADYVAASYWSPADRLRHTVIRHPLPPRGLAGGRLASAFAFYVLTFGGAAKELHSVVQFIAERANAKFGLATEFSEVEHSVTLRESVWVLPVKTADAALTELGFTAFAKELRDAMSISELRDGLGLALRSSGARPRHDVVERATRFVSGFGRRAATASADLRRAGEIAAERLSVAFGISLSIDQALFMIGTQALWRQACPTQFMYAFPTVAANTACIMTVGVRQPLGPEAYSIVAFLARTLFLHPLLRDYAWKQARQEAEGLAVRRMQLFRRLLGHNLPKFLIRPAATELRRIERLIDNQADNRIPAELHATVKRLRFLLGHYDTVLAAVMSSTTLKSSFGTQQTKSFDLFEVIRPQSELALDVMRHRASPLLQGSLRLKLTSRGPAEVEAHEVFVIEVLFNLLSNAIEAISPTDVAEEPSRAVIDVEVDGESEAAYVSLRIRDRGIGMSEAALRSFRDASRHLENAASQEEFWKRADGLVEKRVLSEANEEHMGLGLLYCITYMRSLAWQSAVGEAGNADLSSSRSKGTEIRLRFPRIPRRT